MNSGILDLKKKDRIDTVCGEISLWYDFQLTMKEVEQEQLTNTPPNAKHPIHKGSDDRFLNMIKYDYVLGFR